MANFYNGSPMQLTTAMGSGWRSLQTLNTGTIPGYTSVRQWGIRIIQVIWTGMTAAGHTFSIQDPLSGVILLQGQAGTTLADQLYDTSKYQANWRDFQLTQISSGTLQIWWGQ